MQTLTEKITAKIAQQGPITFREFMQMALYDSVLGYYRTASAKIGTIGDYYTSSNISAEFGSLLATYILELHHLLGTDSIQIVEIGAGTGRLALDILTALGGDAGYVICETSPAMQSLQREMLQSQPVEWLSIEQLATSPITGVILANEVVDSLPVHKLRWRQNRLWECYVDATTDGLRELYLPPSTEELQDFLDLFQIALVEGQTIEICLDARTWLEEVSKAIEQGYLVTLDYGDLNDHRYLQMDGTLRCFYRHTVNSEPLARVGLQDITADVDFSSLIYWGRCLGLQPVKYERQADFLIGLGLLERLQGMMSAASLRDRIALKQFFIPGGISDHFRVLVQCKSLASSLQ